MKNLKRVITLLLLAALLLAGCVGNKFTVDYENQTIFDGKHTYQYTDKRTMFDRTIRIVYPNGGIYHWEENIGEHSSQSYGRGNELYDPVAYARGEDLVDAIVAPEQEPVQESFEVLWPMIIAGLVYIGLGIWFVANPYVHWKWRFGRWIKDSEPSDEGIGRIMASGYLLIGLGVISILIGIFAG